MIVYYKLIIKAIQMKQSFKVLLLSLFLSIIVNANEIININSKIKIAQKENKHIMIFFHIPHCKYCASMINYNFKDKNTIKQIEEHFIYIDIYTKDNKVVEFKEFKGSTKEFSKFIGASAYPATLFIDNNGKVIHQSIGYRNTDELITEIKYISTRSYNTIKLETFSYNLEFEKDD